MAAKGSNADEHEKPRPRPRPDRSVAARATGGRPDVARIDARPLSRKLATAPIDDEPFTDEERQAVAAAIEWSKHHEPIPLENVLADFGLTMDDWEAMGKTPLANEENSTRNR